MLRMSSWYHQQVIPHLEGSPGSLLPKVVLGSSSAALVPRAHILGERDEDARTSYETHTRLRTQYALQSQTET